MAATYSDEEWDAIHTLITSRYRRETAQALADNGPITPSGIADRTDIPITHVSRSLTELRDHNPALAELLVPEDTTKGRIYALTDAGRDAIDRAHEVAQ